MKFFATKAALLSLALTAVLHSNPAFAQCATCPQPLAPQPTIALSPVAPVAPVTQVAFSPVVAQQPVLTQQVAVQQPVVLQTVPPARPIFSGRILRRIFGQRDPVVAAPLVAAPIAATPTFTTAARPILGSPTLVTAAYQPTYPLTTAYAVPQTVARPVTLATTFRPVTLTPACCPTTACCPTCQASGVTTAGFNAPVASCPNCAAGASTFVQPFNPQAGATVTPSPATGETPQPGLAPNAAVPDQRLRPLPGDSVLTPEPTSPGSTSPSNGSGTKGAFDVGTDSDAYWQPPQLFNPNTRTTSRPSAPVWNAVYQQGQASSVQQTVHRVGPEAPATRRVQQGASGWRSARN